MKKANTEDTLILIPAYNEEKNIVCVIDDLKKYFNIDVKSIDKVAVVADPLKHNIPQYTDFHHKSYDAIDNAVQVEMLWRIESVTASTDFDASISMNFKSLFL